MSGETPVNHGQPYSQLDDAKILAHLVPDKVLGKELGRRPRSIGARRFILEHPDLVKTPYRRTAEAERSNRIAYLERGFQGGKARKWTAEDDLAIMRRGRPSDRVLSHELRRSISTIQRRRGWLIKQGVPEGGPVPENLNYRPYKPDQDAAILAGIIPVTDLAKQFGRTKWAIYTRRSNLKNHPSESRRT